MTVQISAQRKYGGIMRFTKLRIPITVALWVFVALPIFWLSQWIVNFDGSSVDAITYNTVGISTNVIEIVAFGVAASLWTSTQFGRPVVTAAITVVLAVEVGYRVFDFVWAVNHVPADYELASNYWTFEVPIVNWFSASEFGYTGFQFVMLIVGDILTLAMVATLVSVIMMRPDKGNVSFPAPAPAAANTKNVQAGAKFCSKCGTPRPTSGEFCPSCGTSLTT